jgi:hypothetical protein
MRLNSSSARSVAFFPPFFVQAEKLSVVQTVGR